ncbi:MAG: response regulator transcription factor [SAR202 cluster bacterium]|nr:response regulator transcription factor [SAR202 cluster bacterium]
MAPEHLVQSNGAVAGDAASPRRQRDSILLVEDDNRLMRLERFILEEEGHPVVAVASGEEALQYLASSRPALVLLDIGLPGMDGFTTCQRIREISEVPIILVTSRDVAVGKVQGLEMGADDYITKPFLPEELAARVMAALRRSRLGYGATLGDEDEPGEEVETGVSDAAAAGQQSADAETYEGVVRVSLEAAASLRQVMLFVGQLRQNPQFRLLRLAANQSSKNGMDIWLSLRQPVALKKVLTEMGDVSQVTASQEPEKAGGERRLTVLLKQ